MKKQLLAIALFVGILTTSAQVNTGTTTQISDFENVTLTSKHQTVYNDSTGGGGFTSGNASFPSKWDTAYGGLWSSGWACSSVNDTINSYPNLYGCSANRGYNNSNKYAVGTTSNPLILRMTDTLLGKTVTGMYICNSTYAYTSMKNGDFISPKFSAANKDWFKLTVKKYFHGNLSADSSEIYLADFRYADTTQNYILKNWQWVGLSSLGNVDSLTFALSSTQNDPIYGMNTPAFFCIDNLTLNTNRDTLETGIKSYFSENSLNLYPNPAVTETEIVYNTTASVPVNMRLIDLLGNELVSQRAQSFAGLNKFKIDVSTLPAGVYYITLNAGNNYMTKKLIKQ
ncbi:MAG: DUF4465 domain-containing protein [Bacteroidia bacterium]